MKNTVHTLQALQHLFFISSLFLIHIQDAFTIFGKLTNMLVKINSNPILTSWTLVNMASQNVFEKNLF